MQCNKGEISMNKIILASGSPRRKDLLTQVGIPFEVIVSNADETITGPPDQQVQALALRKAIAVQNTRPSHNDIILAADTLVYIDNKVLGKPETPSEAFNMLKSLAGRSHTVYTGVAILHGSEKQVFVDSTKVFFRNLSDSEIQAYIATGEPMDKAGAYGVQDKGALLVDHIEGDYFTVVGLPIAKVGAALREMGIEVWGSPDSTT